MSKANAIRLKRGLALLVLFLALPLLAREALAFAIVAAPNCLKASAPLAQDKTLTLGASARDGDRIAATVLEPKGAVKGSIVLLHGVRMERHALSQTAVPFVQDGYRAILVDLRGHGESEGHFLTYGVREAEDLSSLLDDLERRDLLQAPVGAYGFSYGGAVAIQLAARDPRIKAVAAVSTFSNLQQVVSDYARRYVPVFGAYLPGPVIRSAVDEAGRIASFDPGDANAVVAASKLNVPLLLMHGGQDEQVRPYHSVALLRAAGARASLVVLPGETHASMYADRHHEVRRRCVQWFDRTLASRS